MYLLTRHEVAAAPKTKRQKMTRPDFTSETRFEKLISLFSVASTSELNDCDRFTWDVVKNKAAELSSSSTDDKKDVAPECEDCCAWLAA